mmetsp:Transcript_24996/g.41820  ORF Transcript_24996/g.41820 Transcript_24996/m.41820 type:complete len:219 (+) Transcript_24996:3084-3740(+)
MMSRLKCSIARYGRQASTVLGSTSSLSITSLKPFNVSMNLSTLPIIFCAACQLLSLGLDCSRMMITAVISSTPAGGFLRDLASPRSFLLSVSRAASAACTRGSAAARSASTDTCLAATAVATAALLSASMVAASFSMAALAFSSPTFSAKASADTTFSSTSMAFTLACSTSTSTSRCVFSILSRPFCKRSTPLLMRSRAACRMFLYNLISSRNVFGVV